jgi:HAD superfamily hydrolase (TIGR01490 family)
MPSLALFDLDFTILDGDSESMWSQFMLEQHIVGQDFVDRIAAFYRDYDEGHMDFNEYMAFFLGPLTLLTPGEREGLRVEYLERIRQVVRPGMQALVQEHRDKGHIPLLISATNHFIAEPIAGLLGFNDLICTNIKREGDLYTTSIDGIPAFREGKVRRVEQWLVKTRFTLEGSWGYSDSFNDLPLLEMVTHPVAVNPDPRLEQIARQSGWKIIRI